VDTCVALQALELQSNHSNQNNSREKPWRQSMGKMKRSGFCFLLGQLGRRKPNRQLEKLNCRVGQVRSAI